MDIRIHCKNYFVNIVSNVNKHVLVRSPMDTDETYEARTNALFGPGNADYIKATKKVICMLEETKNLLKENARRCFPK